MDLSQRIDVDTSGCQHRVRVRDNYWGFASAETTCTTCGQVFDTDREQELRDRDDARQSDFEGSKSVVDVDVALDAAGLKNSHVREYVRYWAALTGAERVEVISASDDARLIRESLDAEEILPVGEGATTRAAT